VIDLNRREYLNLQSFWLNYGEKVPGYDIPVINEKEARAAAGILAMLGTLVIFIGIGFNHIMVARVYLAFLWLDFVARVFNERYSPSLLLGKFIVRNQKPEYVGAIQKRFAWMLGWFISFPMIYWFVLNWDITFFKVLICVLCISLMFLESAFSICIGCIIYKLITQKDPQHCPGGACEIQKKEPIQIFNPLQKIITVITVIALGVGIYLFLAKTESKTFFGDFLHEAVLTKAELQKEKDEKYQKEMDAEFGDDDF
jgi:hypothetical protein